jgi:hypothetical protein
VHETVFKNVMGFLVKGIYPSPERSSLNEIRPAEEQRGGGVD